MRFPYFNLISIDQILNLIVITLFCNLINSLTFISNDNQNQNQENSTLDLVYILNIIHLNTKTKYLQETTSKISVSSLKYVYLLRLELK